MSSNAVTSRAIRDALENLDAAIPSTHAGFEYDSEVDIPQLEAMVDELVSALFQFGAGEVINVQRSGFDLPEILQVFADKGIFAQLCVTCAEAITSLIDASEYEIYTSSQEAYIESLQSEFNVLRGEIETGLDILDEHDEG
jgi:hypothetical protein